VEEICIKSGAFCEAQHKKMRIVNEEEFVRNKLRKKPRAKKNAEGGTKKIQVIMTFSASGKDERVERLGYSVVFNLIYSQQ
jgi:hypothetical protein